MPRIIKGMMNDTPEWHAWRDQGIGASDVPIIMRESKFKDPFRLWLEKTHQVEPKREYENDPRAYGKKTEHEAREKYCEQVGEIMPPAFMEADEPDNWMHVSLDCRRPDGKVIAEIKCPVDATDHITAREGLVPAHYYGQVQWALLVSGAERCDYYSYFEGQGILVPCAPDPVYWQTYLRPEVTEFWRRVCERNWTMPMGELTPSSGADWTAVEKACKDLARCKTMVAVAEERKRAAEALLGKLMGGKKKVRAGGVEVTWVYVQGGKTISYISTPSLSMRVRSVG